MADSGDLVRGLVPCSLIGECQGRINRNRGEEYILAGIRRILADCSEKICSELVVSLDNRLDS
jgi:hypothetical protein